MKLEPYFQPVVAHIEAARQGASACLVHCTHGQSRSVSLVLAYFLLRQNVSLFEAFNVVKRSRCVAAPNTSFMSQIAALEAKLNRSVSIDLDHYMKCGKVIAATPPPNQATVANGCVVTVPAKTLRVTEPHSTQLKLAGSNSMSSKPRQKGARRPQGAVAQSGPTGLMGLTVTPAARTNLQRPAAQGVRGHM